MPKTNSTPKEHDVLMGRGKRVSEWPGNIHFRKVVNQNRSAYAAAYRLHKVNIGFKIVAEIEERGGRFLQQDTNGEWVTIPTPRAVEKTCQALREKRQKSNSPPTVKSVFSRTLTFSPSNLANGSQQRPRASPPRAVTNSPKKRSLPTSKKSITRVTLPKARKQNESDVDSETASDDGSDADGGRSNSSSDVDSEETETDESESEKGTPKKISVRPNGSQNAKAHKKRFLEFDDELMMSKLEDFRNRFGHAAVPPGWPSNIRLADWSTTQRQVYRESQRGCIELTSAQQERIQKLTKMGFPWDYEAWHWQSRYDELASKLAAPPDKNTEEPCGGDEKAPIQGQQQHPLANHRSLIDWIEDQRDQYRDGYLQGHPERVEKLRELSIVL